MVHLQAYMNPAIAPKNNDLFWVDRNCPSTEGHPFPL